MASLIGKFWNQVPTRGVVVIEAALIDGEPASEERREILVDRLAAAGLTSVKRPVQPLEGGIGSGLFRTFAALRGDEIAAFASQYGYLGVQWAAAELADGRQLEGEPVILWLAERDRMHDAIEAWDALRSGAPVPVGHPWFVYDAAIHAGRPIGWEDLANWVNTATAPDLFRAGRGTTWALGPGEDRPLTFQIVAHTLLQALWLQLGLAIDRNKDYRACVTCGRWFELNPETARTNRRYCSDGCRSKAYRTRKPDKARRARGA